MPGRHVVFPETNALHPQPECKFHGSHTAEPATGLVGRIRGFTRSRIASGSIFSNLGGTDRSREGGQIWAGERSLNPLGTIGTTTDLRPNRFAGGHTISLSPPDRRLATVCSTLCLAHPPPRTTPRRFGDTADGAPPPRRTDQAAQAALAQKAARSFTRSLTVDGRSHHDHHP